MESDYTTDGEAERCDASSVSEDPSTRELHETEYPGHHSLLECSDQYPRSHPITTSNFHKTLSV